MTFKDLHTPRLLLRPLCPEDAEAVFAYRSLPEVSRYQCWEPRSAAEILDFIRGLEKIRPDTPDTWYQLAVVLRASGELAGDCGLHFPAGRNHEAEIGITLAPAYHGQGLAAEALPAVLGYLFDTLGKHRVYGSVDPRNVPSQRLLERVGMRREAHFVESLPFKGGWADDVIYALLDREWAARK